MRQKDSVRPETIRRKIHSSLIEHTMSASSAADIMQDIDEYAASIQVQRLLPVGLGDIVLVHGAETSTQLRAMIEQLREYMKLLFVPVIRLPANASVSVRQLGVLAELELKSRMELENMLNEHSQAWRERVNWALAKLDPTISMKHMEEISTLMYELVSIDIVEKQK